MEQKERILQKFKEAALARSLKSYIGLREDTPLKKGNLGKIWVKCTDGNYRSKDSPIIVNQDQVDSDEINGFLRRLT